MAKYKICTAEVSPCFVRFVSCNRAFLNIPLEVPVISYIYITHIYADEGGNIYLTNDVYFIIITMRQFILFRQAILDGDVHCVPLITGTCRDEGLLNMSHILKEPIRFGFSSIGNRLEYSVGLGNTIIELIELMWSTYHT